MLSSKISGDGPETLVTQLMQLSFVKRCYLQDKTILTEKTIGIKMATSI